MAKTALAKLEDSVNGKPITRERFDCQKLSLSDCEAVIIGELYEGFVRAGVALEAIKRGKKFTEAGYTSFDAYMDSGRLRMKSSQAWRLISAAAFRLSLTNSPSGELPWTEASCRPFTKVEPASQARRLANTLAKRVKAGEPFAPATIKAVIDNYTGKLPAARKSKAKALRLASTPGEVVTILREQIREGYETLSAFTENNWDEADADFPGSVKELTREVADLLSYLRS